MRKFPVQLRTGRWRQHPAQHHSKKAFDVDNVPAARDFVAAYVSFFKFAEGEDHEHGHEAHTTASALASHAHGHH